jgi:hypothetical protein
MDRKEIMFGMMNADIVCGEFKNSWLTCGVVNEALVLGKPLLHFRDDKLYSNDYAELYPVLNAGNETDISSQLQYYVKNSASVIEKSKYGIEWIEKYTVKDLLKLLIEQINNGSSKTFKITFESQIKLLIIRANYLFKVNYYKALEKLSIKI